MKLNNVASIGWNNLWGEAAMKPKAKNQSPESKQLEEDLLALGEAHKQQWEASEADIEKLLALPSSSSWIANIQWGPLVLRWGPLTALASLMALVWMSWPSNTQPILIPKGNLWRILYAHEQAEPGAQLQTQELKNGTRLYPKDMIQFAYKIDKPTYVLIVGMNDQGTIYPLVQEASGGSLLLKPGKGAFPRQRGSVKSFRLDRYIGQERFFVVSSLKPFRYARLKQALHTHWNKQSRNLRALENVPGPWSTYTVHFLKRTRPSSPKE